MHDRGCALIRVSVSTPEFVTCWGKLSGDHAQFRRLKQWKGVFSNSKHLALDVDCINQCGHESPSDWARAGQNKQDSRAGWDRLKAPGIGRTKFHEFADFLEIFKRVCD